MAIFSLSGKTLDEKERLKSTDRLFAMQSFANFTIFIGMQLRPVSLLRSDIMSMISLCVHGLMKIDSLYEFSRND